MENNRAQPVPTVVVKKVIRAKRDKVFEAWLEPDLLRQWLIPPCWSARVTVDARRGGRFHHEMIVGTTDAACGPRKAGDVLLHEGEYLEITRPTRLVFTWSSHAASNTKVTVDFRELGETTEVTITHELLDTDERRRQHAAGWANMLVSLDALLGG